MAHKRTPQGLAKRNRKRAAKAAQAADPTVAARLHTQYTPPSPPRYYRNYARGRYLNEGYWSAWYGLLDNAVHIGLGDTRKAAIADLNATTTAGN